MFSLKLILILFCNGPLGTDAGLVSRQARLLFVPTRKKFEISLLLFLPRIEFIREGQKCQFTASVRQSVGSAAAVAVAAENIIMWPN